MKVLIFLAVALTGCASRSVLPDIKEVKVSREDPDKGCQEIGRLTGTSNSRSATNEELLNDLKKEAAQKGANFVKVEQYSSYGTSVTGLGYSCP